MSKSNWMKPCFAAWLLIVCQSSIFCPAASAAETAFGPDIASRSATILRLAQYDEPPRADARSFGPHPLAPEAGPATGAPAQRLTYHGFTLDLSRTDANPNLSATIAAVEHQIDIVDSVGLDRADLKLFRSLPIRVSNRPFGGGHFRGGAEVEVGGMTAADNRPILLHEYMHAYHFYRLPGGFHNADIRRFYEDAVQRNLYEPGSYMLSNPLEFFAMTASCYLDGTVARAPYRRDTIAAAQPDYYAYLGRLFGHAASHARRLPDRAAAKAA